MKAGDLRHRITLQRRSVAGGLDTWADVATVWAAIEPLAGNQYYQNLVATTEVTGRIRIRYRPDVRPEWRVKFGTRILAIVGLVSPKEAVRELHIMYREAL